MQIKMNSAEETALYNLLRAYSVIKNLQHDPDFDYGGARNLVYHLEVKFTTEGNIFTVVIPELGVSKDITDYAK